MTDEGAGPTEVRTKLARPEMACTPALRYVAWT